MENDLVKKLVAEDRLEEALTELLKYSEYTSFNKTALAATRNFRVLKKKVLAGTIGASRSALAQNQLSYAILELNELIHKEKPFNPADTKKVNQNINTILNNQNNNKLLIISIAILFFSILLILITINFNNKMVIKDFDNRNGITIIDNDSSKIIINTKVNEIPDKVFKLSIASFLASNIFVNKGDSIIIKANGGIIVGRILGQVGPDGRESGLFGMTISEYNIIENYPHGSLLMKIGDGNWMFCGKDYEYVADTDGELLFRINDNILYDNRGAFDASVKIYSK